MLHAFAADRLVEDLSLCLSVGALGEGSAQRAPGWGLSED